jgi:hypothetical protein
MYALVFGLHKIRVNWKLNEKGFSQFLPTTTLVKRIQKMSKDGITVGDFYILFCLQNRNSNAFRFSQLINSIS